MRDSRLCRSAVVAAALLLAACGAEGTSDGRDLPPFDLDRVQVGDTAPDFSLESYDGPAVTLSEFRGSKDVVLVFYRGHW